MTASSEDPSWMQSSYPAAESTQIEVPRRQPATCCAPWLRQAVVQTVIVSIVVVVTLQAGFSSGCTPSGTTAPPFEDVSMDASALSSRCSSGLASAQTMAEALRKAQPASIDALLERINDMDVTLSISSFAYLLSEVSPDEVTRDAATECYLSISQFTSELYLDRALYERVAAFSGAAASDRLAQLRYSKLVEAFERAGIGLPSAAERARAQNISNELSELTTAFNHRLSGDTRTYTFAATNASLLAGLSGEFVAAHTDEDGQVTITTDYPDTTHVYRYARSAALRRTLYGLARSRGAPENLATLQRVLELRWQYARLLGWEHYADYVTATKMIGAAAKADAFTRAVANLTTSTSSSELDRLRALKRAELGLVDDAPIELEAYDRAYFGAQLEARDYALNATELARYFRYGNTRDGVLHAAARLFHVRFARRADVPAWHEDVEVYDVHCAAAGGCGGRGAGSVDGSDANADGAIGRIYLDMHPRANKYKHAAQFGVRDGVMGVQRPEGALVTNFPISGAMEHSQVVTFFHEFGHLMHHVLGGQAQRWALFSGVATEWDFVEAPSQMLEAWAFDAPTLAAFAAHEESGAPIPDALVAALRRADTFGRGADARQQMFYAQISLQLHMRDPTAPGFDAEAVAAELAAELSPYPQVPGTHFVANFGHLMGYSAIYYTYMWSQALAQALLQPFKQAGFYDAAVGLRYRDLVLRPGGALPAATLVYSFLGEPPSLDALHVWLRGEE